MMAFPKPGRRLKVPRPLKRRIYIGAKRAAAKAQGTLTADEWLRICAAYQFGCAYPGKHAGRLQVDHIKAISRGGQHVAANVVPCCEKHNHDKGSLTREPLPGHPYR